MAVPTTATISTAGPAACALPASIECALQTAGVSEPAAMMVSLLSAELRTFEDVAELNAAEAAELFNELRVASVPLGDRARLRKATRNDGWGVTRGIHVLLQSRSVPPVAESFSEKTRTNIDQQPLGPNSAQEREPSKQHRQLQSGGGFSLEVAAIAFTGLIGMVGYIVQARSTQNATQAQASLGLEMAEREKVEVKAGKQLERVQLQMAEWVRPLVIQNIFVWHGWSAVTKVTTATCLSEYRRRRTLPLHLSHLPQELQLSGYLSLYEIAYSPAQLATPYIDLYNSATSPALYAAMGAAPYAQLPPEDLRLLAADPALRFRYCELAATVLLPPLRRMSDIIGTKTHLNESLAPARLDSLLPGIGRGWASFIGTLSNVFAQLYVYVAQFESVVARWEQEQFDLLQPDSPGLHHILTFLFIEQVKDVAAKEVELVGLSSGGRALVGGLDFTKGGLAGGTKEAET
jgi:hypothetical protein